MKTIINKNMIRISLKVISCIVTIIISGSFFISCSASKSQSLDEYINAYVSAMDFHGTILVSQKENILHHKAYGLAEREWDVPNTLNSRYQIASISKPMTAFVVMNLVESGLMKLDDPLSKYLPSFPREKGDSITIHQLLTHTGGIGHYQDAPEIEAWKERIPHTKDELIQLFGEIPLVAKPGSKFAYSSFGYNLLAFACESATGESFVQLMDKYVFKPTGMEHSNMMSEVDIIPGMTSGYEYKQLGGVQRTTPFHPSIVIGSGGVVCTAYDLYRFANYFFHSNQLSEEIRDLMTSRQAPVAPNYFYGYGWWLGTSTIASCDYISHGGQQNGYKSELWFYPRHNIIIVVLSNIRYNEGEWGYDEPKRPYIDGLKNNIVRLILGLPADAPQKSLAKELSRWILQYGTDAAIARYREIRHNLPKEYYSSEMEINMLGYNYYKIRRDFGTASAILLQNVSDYPNSYNVYDTMGWLYDQIEAKVQARVWYLKGLEVYEKYPE